MSIFLLENVELIVYIDIVMRNITLNFESATLIESEFYIFIVLQVKSLFFVQNRGNNITIFY